MKQTKFIGLLFKISGNLFVVGNNQQVKSLQAELAAEEMTKGGGGERGTLVITMSSYAVDNVVTKEQKKTC